MTPDQKTEECRTKCLLASAGGAAIALILMMALFGAAFLVALLVAVIVFFVLAYFVPRHYCTDAEIDQPVATPDPVAPAPPKAEKPAVAAAPSETKVSAETVTKVVAKPAKAPVIQDVATVADDATGTQPQTLNAPRGGKADNLKLIKGVGPKLESLLHEMGFYHFDQIAGWTADEVVWVDQNLQGVNKGRASRDNWLAQATLLADGGETEFSKRASKGDVYK